MTAAPRELLAGRRVLLVEDDYFIASDMMHALGARGAVIVGPASSVKAALDLIEATDRLDGALLDINLRGETAYPVADALIGRGVSFVFATGYDEIAIPPRYSHVARCEKPVDLEKVANALFG